MRRACQNMWHKALAIWVCILLCVSGVPTVPAWAEDSAVPTTAPATEVGGPSTDTQSTPEQGPAEPAAAVATYMSGTLSQEYKADDGATYTVTVAFDESACVPEGAELRVELPVADDAATADSVKSRVERALALGNDDRILTIDYLAVSIVAGGRVVSPASAVNVEVQTDAIEPSRSAFVEVVVMGADEAVEGGSPDNADASAPTDGTGMPSDECVIPQNLTDNKEDAQVTRLSFSARSLGTIALASVATRQDVWNGEGLAVSVLAPRYGLAISTADEAAPELEEGVDCLACFAIQAEPRPAYGTSLWLEAPSSEEVVQQENEQLGGVLAYLLDDEGGISGDPLCGPEGLTEPLELSASSKVLLVRDSGYRSTTLELDGVTVEGMMPEGTVGTAREVTQDYAKPEALMVGLDKDSARAVKAGTLEVAPLAAYDIALEAKGEEYQPDEDHPLTVTITNNAINDAVAAGKDMQVWHLADDGTVEVIDDFTLANGSVMFKASGFSTYLLVTKSATPESKASLSSSFRITASAKTYERSSTVTFVDESQHPIMGTVTDTLNVSFTGSGSASNETNTIDMYRLADKLNPAIADEYEFSRVYVTLNGTGQKDFRYIQVGDDTAIGGTSTTTYRAYFNMNGIAQNASGKDYSDAWYDLGTSGDMGNVYIEYLHVAPASFHAIDTHNDPVVGAEFALYADAECRTPLKHKNAVVKATSDKQGLVSFGKIPRGTYYMKETVTPEGYKKLTDTYTIVVDGTTAIADVVHSEDDDSSSISDVMRMKLTNEWDDGADKHANDSVEVTVYAQGKPVGDPILLTAQNSWTYTLEGLDPNETYTVSETAVKRNGEDVTNEWVPTITYNYQSDLSDLSALSDGTEEGAVDSSATKSSARRKANVRSVDVTIANRNTNQIQNVALTSFEITLVTEGDYADRTRAFEFEMELPTGMSQLTGTKDGKTVDLTNEHATFTLTHGQTICFTDVPASVDYELSQTKVASYDFTATVTSADGTSVSVPVDATTEQNKYKMTLSQISGTSDKPAQVTIKNKLQNTSVPNTGVDDNVIVWAAIVAGSIFLMALVWRKRRFVR